VHLSKWHPFNRKGWQVKDGKIITDKNNFIGWKFSETIRQYGKNHLEVRRNNNSLELYINNKLVHKTNSVEEFFGKYFGFIVTGIQTVVFSSFKINTYKEDIDYASDLIINASNFKKVKNLTLYFLLQTYLKLNQPLTFPYGIPVPKISKYAPSHLRLFFDKALILIGKIYQKDTLLMVGFFNSNDDANYWKDLASLLFLDLDTILKLTFEKDKDLQSNGIQFEKRFLDTDFKKIKDDYILKQYNKKFLNWKNQLLEFQIKAPTREDFLFDIELFRKSKLCKSHFSSTLNNPFRILALKHNATDKEIANRISDLLVYAELGKEPKYDTDLFFGAINRTAQNITDAAKKIENPTQKLYYALLWFIELNNLDKAFFKKIQNIDKGEITSEFKSVFIEQAPDFFENKINYFDAVKKVNELMFLNAQKLNEDFIDDLQSEKEEISFCLNEEIISLIPLNDNSVRINNEIVLNSNTDNGFWLLNETYFDYRVDYEIEFECEWLEGEDKNKLYSIVFSKDSGNNYYRFGMSANNFLYFDAVVNGINQNLYGWKRLNDFYFKSKNKLKIVFNSERNEFEFFINDKIVRETGRFFGIKALEKPSTGNIIGVSVLGKQKVSFSNIKLSYTHRFSKPVSKFKVRSSNVSIRPCTSDNVQQI